jgi:Trypsin
VKHPSFSSTTLANDFAVITLSSDVVFNNSISPICLPVDGGAVHENKYFLNNFEMDFYERSAFNSGSGALYQMSESGKASPK